MAKAAKKKSAKEASETFHNIMKASVKGNPKPTSPDIATLMQYLKQIEREIAKTVPDFGDYTIMQVSQIGSGQLFYNINDSCPKEKSQKIEEIIKNNAALLNIKTATDYYGED